MGARAPSQCLPRPSIPRLRCSLPPGGGPVCALWRRVRCGARGAGGRRAVKNISKTQKPALSSKHFCKKSRRPLTVCMPPPTLYTSYSAYTAPRTGGCNSRYRCNLARLYTVQYAVSTQRRGVVQSYLLPVCHSAPAGGQAACRCLSPLSRRHPSPAADGASGARARPRSTGASAV